MPFGQFPSILAGTDLTAALLLSMLPRTGWKSSDSPARALTTTLADDPDLQFSMEASSTYIFAALLFASGAALGTADLKVAWAWPTGATAAWTGLGITTSSTSPNIVAVRTTSGTSNPFGINGSETPALLWGSVSNGSTAGPMKVQWAQNTSNGTGTVMKAQSAVFSLRSQ